MKTPACRYAEQLISSQHPYTADWVDDAKATMEALVRECERQAIDVRPGDTLVLSHPQQLSEHAYQNMVAALRGRFPHNNCVVLEDGAQLAVFRTRR